METLKTTEQCIKNMLETPIEEFYRKNNLVLDAVKYYNEEYNAFICIRNFLDDFYHYENYRQKMIDEEPYLTGDKRFDVFLAALCEHFAYHYNLKTPDWVFKNERFLKKWWFPENYEFMTAMCLVQSPASFKRRGIFIDNSFFERV
jgi:hypothetical protein